eukprot:9347292-Heterocapsa_arctica.AAC.1
MPADLVRREGGPMPTQPEPSGGRATPSLSQSDVSGDPTAAAFARRLAPLAGSPHAPTSTSA